MATPCGAVRQPSTQAGARRWCIRVSFVASCGVRLAVVNYMGDPKTLLHCYLQEAREALVWNLDGLGERDARLPRTPAGNSILRVLKHCLNVEAGYFG
jgi:Protein of unknown function (DUF664)